MYVNGKSILAIGIIFPILGTAAVTARFWVRVKHRIGLGLDDWFCLPALLILIATGGIYIAGAATHTLGYHSPPQSTGETLEYNTKKADLLNKFEAIVDIMNPVATGFIRLSFLFFYRRIFRGRAFNIVSWTVIGLVIGEMLAFFIGHMAGCGDHFSAMWNTLEARHNYCIKTFTFLGLLGITDFVLDVIVLSIPFFWIWRLHMKSSQKLIVSSVFLCGIFTVAIGAVRMAGNIEVMNYKFGVEENVLGDKGVNDEFGAISAFLFWQYIENGTGMVVCCLPALNPLAKDIIKAINLNRLRQLSSLLLGLRSSTGASTGVSAEKQYESERSASSLAQSQQHDDSVPQREFHIAMTVDHDQEDRLSLEQNSTSCFPGRHRDEENDLRV